MMKKKKQKESTSLSPKAQGEESKANYQIR